MDRILDLCLDITAVSADDPAYLQVQASVYCEALNLRHDGGTFCYPLSPSERDDLRWYLEEYWKWPYAGFAFRGAEVERLLPELGQRLYQATFLEGPAREIMQQWQSTTSGDHQVSIITTDPKALSLPWELLHNGQEFLVFQRNIPVTIVRRLAVELPSAVAVTFKKPLRILMVTARPIDEKEVDVRTIAREVLGALHDQIAAGAIELEFLRPPTLERLEERLQDKKRPVHILHFDGHGKFGTIPGLLDDVQMGQIFFEKEDGRSAPVMGKTLAKILNDAGVQLAVLNACQSATIGANDVSGSMAVELIRGGIKAVVAMSATVLAVSAAAYVNAFYGALASGGSVQEAHEQAQRTLRENPARDPLQRRKDEMAQPVILHDWWLPILYQEQPLSLQLLKARPRPKKSASAVPRLSESMPAPPRYEFSGRGTELLRIERSLGQGKIVVINGFGGIGKTAMVREAADWQTRTKMYDGACFVSFEHGGDASVVMSVLGNYLQINDGNYHPYDPPAALAVLAPLLKKKRYLIIADNAESILPGGDAPLDDDGYAQLWETLSRLRAMDSGVLITTRNPNLANLGFPPDIPVDYLELKGLVADDAHALAVRVLQAFKIDPAQIPYADIHDLLDRLDNHPLAIQLVLPALANLPPTTVLDDLTMLVSTIPDEQVKGRNRSLQASLDYSLQRLNDEQRALLLRLALFEGGALENNILNITQMSQGEWEALRTALEQAALLTQELIHPAMKAKFQHFHPVLAPYLRGLPGSDDPAQREQYIENYYQMAYFLSIRDKDNPDRIRAMAQREFPNMLNALRLLFHSGDIGLITAVADILIRFLDYFGRWRERDALRLRVLEAIRPANAQGGGMLTWEVYWQEKSLGQQELEKGDWQSAVKRFQVLLFAIEMLPEGEEIGPYSIAHITTLQQIARGLQNGGQFDKATEQLRQALAITDELLLKEENKTNQDLKHILGTLRADYGDLLRKQGLYAEAKEAYEEARRIAHDENDQRGEAVMFIQLGSLALVQEDFAGAIISYRDAYKRSHTLGEQAMEATVLHQMGIASSSLALQIHSNREAGVYGATPPQVFSIESEQAILVEAEEEYRESLKLQELLGDDVAAAETSLQLGILAERTDRYDEAKDWYTRALKLFEQVAPGSRFSMICLNDLAHLLVNEYYPDRLVHLTEAREYAEKALQIAEGLPIEDETWTLYRVLATIAALEGRSKEADHYSRRERIVCAQFPAHRREIDQKFGIFIANIVAAVGGNEQVYAQNETELADLDAQEQTHLVANAIRRIMAGERDWHALSVSIVSYQALILLCILESLDPQADFMLMG